MNWQDHLAPNETLIWQGKPDLTYVHDRLRRDAKWIACGLFILALTAFLPQISAKFTGYILLFAVAASALYLGVLYAKNAPNTEQNSHYAITNSRALALIGEGLTSVNLANVHPQLVVHSHTADILLLDHDNQEKLTFFHIRNAQDVIEMLQKEIHAQ